MTLRLAKCVSSPVYGRQSSLGFYCSRWMSTLTDQVTQDEEKEEATAKPFEAIPGPKGLPFVGTALHAAMGGWMDKFHLHIQNRWRQYGYIYKETIGPQTLVFIGDPDDVAAVLRAEGRYPRRYAFESFYMAREILDQKLGVFLENDEKWQHYRTLLNKKLMRPQQAAVFTPLMDEAACNFVSYLRRKRDQGGRVTDLQGHLFRWAMESGCTAMFNQHLGLLSKDPPQLAKDFISSLTDILDTTNTMMTIPPKVHKALNTKAWRGHIDGWQTSFGITKQLIEGIMEREMEKNEDDQEIPDLVSYLLSVKLSPEEVLGNITDVLGGAVDTTSNTMSFTMYTLARHPDIQEKLHDEVMRFAPDHQAPVRQEQVQKMPYLRGVTKEILRLYPVGYIFSRILNQDAVVHGYKIPAGTNIVICPYVMGRDPKSFDNPEEFRPERWYRENSESVKAFSWLPFGFGPRGCVGRRIAETEMHLVLIRIIQNFMLEQEKPEELVGKIRLVLIPEKSVDLKLTDRN
ncbi:cholesterol side-chain cleavage enzyme, mitochondrial-like [Branchiostoma lanceolatum]|uniref:cholesterol side-chain cleavage enzyme, mitochondrial-like n=1 Tax=Branchiostoma lanceolatum TaxID=7740 RepID=UPI003453BFCE